MLLQCTQVLPTQMKKCEKYAFEHCNFYTQIDHCFMILELFKIFAIKMFLFGFFYQ